MRIIAGNAGGIGIQVPTKVTRPTTDRVREALFSSLGSLVEEASVLDLFAGSGALGMEALSRGANDAVFVEQCGKACSVIHVNLKKTSLADTAMVLNRKVELYLKSTSQSEQFDLIFADPPYGKDTKTQNAIERLIDNPRLHEILKPDGVLILENSTRADQIESEIWQLSNSRSYGESRITFYRKSQP